MYYILLKHKVIRKIAGDGAGHWICRKNTSRLSLEIEILKIKPQTLISWVLKIAPIFGIGVPLRTVGGFIRARGHIM